jgi:hypothetical protein
MILAWVQALNGLARPHPGSGLTRTIWEGLHWLAGRLGVALGVITCLVGVQVLHEFTGADRSQWFIGYATGFVAIALALDFVVRDFLTDQPVQAKEEPYGWDPNEHRIVDSTATTLALEHV